MTRDDISAQYDYNPDHYKFPRTLRELGITEIEAKRRWSRFDWLEAAAYVGTIVGTILLTIIFDRIGG